MQANLGLAEQRLDLGVFDACVYVERSDNDS